MSHVLVTGSTVRCSHGGAVKLGSGLSKLTVQGMHVLQKSDVAGARVQQCPTPATSSTSPCQTVASVVPGVAGKLRVSGSPVLLDSVTGQTDGVPPGTLNVQSVQVRLTAK